MWRSWARRNAAACGGLRHCFEVKKQGAERALQAKYRDYVSEGSAAAISKSRQAGSKLNLGTTGCGAAGSALDWGSRGREFKSRHSDQLKKKARNR